MPVLDKSNPNNGPTTGSVIIDGTTYSGADIKVVVHVYDQNNLLEDQARELRDRIEALESRRRILIGGGLLTSTIDSSISQLRDKLAFLERDLHDYGNISISTKLLAEVQTLSISTYREKYPVRALQTVYPKGFTRGPRTIGGSMIFTVFDKNVLYELLQADPTDFDANRSATSALIDQLPPFDITVSFANELGQTSRMAILGVEFVSEGQVMSIQDLFIENTTQFVARDVDPMTKVGEARRDQNNQIVGQNLATVTGSQLLESDAAQELKAQLDPFAARFKIRQDPFK